MTLKRAAPGWLTSTHYAHRGLHDQTVPENSLKGAERAIEAGFGIECDVQRSRDGTAFVFHDFELDRLTNANGAIGEWSDEGLASLSLLGTNQSPVPLGDFLAVLAGRVPLLIEVKSKPGFGPFPICESVLCAVENYAGHHAVMSFDPRVSQWFQTHSPQTCRGLVGTDSYSNGFETVWRDPDIIDRAHPDFLAIDSRDLARPEAARWRASGRPLLCWTIKTKAQWEIALPLTDALIAEGEALT
ncbi:MAG: glycerophosphodiester phosphodiesterase family protein [Pseudomonadota bacterium]